MIVVPAVWGGQNGSDVDKGEQRDVEVDLAVDVVEGALVVGLEEHETREEDQPEVPRDDEQQRDRPEEAVLSSEDRLDLDVSSRRRAQTESSTLRFPLKRLIVTTSSMKKTTTQMLVVLVWCQ